MFRLFKYVFAFLMVICLAIPSVVYAAPADLAPATARPESIKLTVVADPTKPNRFTVSADVPDDNNDPKPPVKLTVWTKDQFGKSQATVGHNYSFTVDAPYGLVKAGVNAYSGYYEVDISAGAGTYYAKEVWWSKLLP